MDNGDTEYDLEEDWVPDENPDPEMMGLEYEPAPYPTPVDFVLPEL